MAIEAKTEKRERKPNLKYMRDKDREMVKGIFKFFEVPGGTFSFVYRAYKEDEVEKYDFIDGGVYTIPLGVAKHLNKNCWYPVHAHAVDEGGRPLAKIGKKVHRCGFSSLEFIDIDDLGEARAEIITVEKVTPTLDSLAPAVF